MEDEIQKAFAERAKKSMTLVQNYKDTFTDDVGEKVLMDILKDSGMLSICFDSDPLVMAYNEGRRDIALRLMTILEIDMKQYKQLLEEESLQAQGVNYV